MKLILLRYRHKKTSLAGCGDKALQTWNLVKRYLDVSSCQLQLVIEFILQIETIFNRS